MVINRKNLIFVSAALVLACWSIAVFSLAPGIEYQLSKMGNQALLDKGLHGLHVDFDGRDATLRGLALDTAQKKAALQTISEMGGVLSVEDLARVLPAASQKKKVIKKAVSSRTAEQTRKHRKRRLLRRIKAHTIFFHEGSSIIRTKSFRSMVRVAKIMRLNPQAKIELRGYADSLGHKVYNLKLAKGRTLSVLDGLLELGVKRNQLKIKYFGEKIPRATNKNSVGRAENRRVEFRLIKG